MTNPVLKKIKIYSQLCVVFIKCSILFFTDFSEVCINLSTCETNRYFECERNLESLYLANECAVQTSLEVERNPLTGELCGYNEVQNHCL